MKFHKKHIITFACLGLAIPMILASTNLLPGGEIYLMHQEDNEFHIVEVNAKDLNYPFFGTSFHIQFNAAQYEYSHFSLGSYFAQADPIVQVAQKENEIIAGISLKRGSIIEEKNGSLLKIFFHKKSNDTQTSAFDFTHTVFSTYKNGRHNVDNIIFNPN